MQRYVNSFFWQQWAAKGVKKYGAPCKHLIAVGVSAYVQH
jgi:hypothetical protein